MNQQEQFQARAWVIQLVNFFVEEEDYRMIQMPQSQDEVWLVNPKKEENAIIMITSRPFAEMSPEVNMKNRESLSVLFNVKPRGINITVSQIAQNLDDHYIQVAPGYVSESKYARQFRGLEDVLEESKNASKTMSRSLRKLRRSLRRAHKKAVRKLLPVTTSLTTFVLVIYFIGQFMIGGQRRPEVVAVMLGAYYKPFMVEAYEYWRLLTSGFIHIDFFHVLMNLIALRNLGQIMERVLGSKNYLKTLFIGIIFGSMFVFVRNEASIALGLSGGLFALLGAMFVYFYETGAFKNPALLGQVFSIIFMNVLISLMPGVSAAAHLGGFQAGVIMGFIYSKRPDWERLRKYSKGLLVIVTIVLIILMSQNLYYEQFIMLDGEIISAWYELGLKSYANWLARKMI